MEQSEVTWQDFKEIVKRYIDNEVSEEEMLEWCSTNKSSDRNAQSLMEAWVRDYGNG